MKTKQLFRSGLLLSIALIAIGTELCAQSIFSNTITGTSPGLSNPYTSGQTFDAHLTVSGIGRGSGLTGNGANDRYTAVNFTSSSTIDLNDYFEFILTPASGYNI